MMTHEFEQTLQSWFGIPDQAIGRISGYFEPMLLQKDEFFLQAGANARRMAYVQSGLVREYFDDEQGREVTKWIAMPGYFLMDVTAFMFQQPARWHFQALSDCSLLTLSQENYQKICTGIPQWPALEKLFLAKCFAMLEDRIVSHLSLSAEERYEQFFARFPALFNQAPLQYLASLLGMTPETFSRIRKKRSRAHPMRS